MTKTLKYDKHIVPGKKKVTKAVKRPHKVRATPMGRLHNKAKTAFNHWIRVRDCSNSTGGDWGKCFSCDKDILFVDMEAGHYIPGWLISPLRFDEKNVNGQCTYCNKYLSGNYGAYAFAIIKKYGQTELFRLESSRGAHKKWSREELENIIIKYKI